MYSDEILFVINFILFGNFQVSGLLSGESAASREVVRSR